MVHFSLGYDSPHPQRIIPLLVSSLPGLYDIAICYIYYNISQYFLSRAELRKMGQKFERGKLHIFWAMIVMHTVTAMITVDLLTWLAVEP